MRFRLAAVAVFALMIGSAHVSAVVHEVTYKGTVASATDKAIKIKVVNEETEETSEMAFDLDENTKILRGDDLVSFAAARIRNDESISVTVNTDDDDTLAIVVRLTPRR